MSREQPHWFLRLQSLLAETRVAPIIDLSIGQPDGASPEAISSVLAQPADTFAAYPPAIGAPSLRSGLARWASDRYGLTLDADGVVVTHGSRIGVVLAPLAFTQPGDVVVVPVPGYPSYSDAVRLLGRRVRRLPLTFEHGYEPRPDALRRAFEGAAMAYLSYPCNPTGAAGSRAALEAAVEAAADWGTVIVHDAAYAELRHDGERMSILSVEGAERVAIELHSFSKMFHMAGWRTGFALGSGPLIEAFGRIMGLSDTGATRASQALAAAVLAAEPDFGAGRRARDRRRTNHMAGGLEALGCRVFPPAAAFYVWFQLPRAAIESGIGWSAVVRDAGVACAPGDAFGPDLDDWIRFTCVRDEDVLDDVLERMARLLDVS